MTTVKSSKYKCEFPRCPTCKFSKAKTRSAVYLLKRLPSTSYHSSFHQYRHVTSREDCLIQKGNIIACYVSWRQKIFQSCIATFINEVACEFVHTTRANYGKISILKETFQYGKVGSVYINSYSGIFSNEN